MATSSILRGIMTVDQETFDKIMEIETTELKRTPNQDKRRIRGDELLELMRSR